MASGKKTVTSIPKLVKYKFSWGEQAPVSGIYECSICENLEAFKKGEFFAQCQECINTHEEKENKWYVTNDFVFFMSKNSNEEFEEEASFHMKVANIISEWAGNIWFVYLHIVWFGIWISINLGYTSIATFDPYPFGLLTMIVSLEAIFLSTFILMSQNLLSQKTELRSEHEYQVNLEAERNVAEIYAIVKEMKENIKLNQAAVEEIRDTIHTIASASTPDSTQTEPTVDSVPLEAIEKEHFEEHEQLLEEAGIDVIPESAPPVVLEEQIRKKRGRKKKATETVEDKIEHV